MSLRNTEKKIEEKIAFYDLSGYIPVNYFTGFHAYSERTLSHGRRKQAIRALARSYRLQSS